MEGNFVVSCFGTEIHGRILKCNLEKIVWDSCGVPHGIIIGPTVCINQRAAWNKNK